VYRGNTPKRPLQERHAIVLGAHVALLSGVVLERRHHLLLVASLEIDAARPRGVVRERRLRLLLLGNERRLPQLLDVVLVRRVAP